MYSKNIQKKNNTFISIGTYPMFFSVLMFFSWYFFLSPEGRWHHAKELVYFLIFPVCVLFLTISIERIVKFLLRGKNVEFIAKSIVTLGTGLAIFLMFYFIFNNSNLKNVSIGIIFLTIAIIVYRLREIYRSSIYSESIIVAGSYIIAGITVEIMYDALSTIFDTRYSINKVLMLSFITLAFMQLISLMDVTRKANLVKVSMWLKRNHLLKFVVISTVFFMLFDVRRAILFKDVKSGWIFLFVVLFVVFLILIISIRNAIKKEPDVKLKKHLQKITYDKIRDISNISAYVDDFILTGKKSGITSYLFYMAYRVEIPVVIASKIIAPILEYKDIEISEIMSKRAYEVIEERNRQNRTKVVEDVTNNLEFYGRGRQYDYKRASTIKPKNN